MAEYKGARVKVEGLLRPCLANDKKALFHGWFQHSKVVPPSPMVGGHTGGQLSTLLGLVEWEDGSVHAVQTWEVKFLDTPGQMGEFEACYAQPAQHEQPTTKKKANPYGVIRYAIGYIRDTASAKQYSYAEGLLRMAHIAEAITEEQYQELTDYLESLKGYCYKDQEAEHLVNRMEHGVMQTVKKVPAPNGPAILFQEDVEKALEAFFKNFKKEKLR